MIECSPRKPTRPMVVNWIGWDHLLYPVLCRYLEGPLGVKRPYGAHTGDANRGGRLGPRSNNEE